MITSETIEIEEKKIEQTIDKLNKSTQLLENSKKRFEENRDSYYNYAMTSFKIIIISFIFIMLNLFLGINYLKEINLSFYLIVVFSILFPTILCFLFIRQSNINSKEIKRLDEKFILINEVNKSLQASIGKDINIKIEKIIDELTKNILNYTSEANNINNNQKLNINFNWIQKNIKLSFDIVYSLVFYISLISIVIVIVFILGAIYNNYRLNNDIVIKMLPVLGIALSALLASSSVMKSIQNTNSIEKKKKENELEMKKNKFSFYSTLIQAYMYMYIVDLKKIASNDLKDDLLKDFEKILVEYLQLMLSDNEIKTLNDKEIRAYIFCMDMNIFYIKKYLNKKDIPLVVNKEELIEIFEDNFKTMKEQLLLFNKKYKIVS